MTPLKTTPTNLDGKDIWQFPQVQSRYRRYCAHFGIEHTELVFHPYYVERGWTAGILDVLVDRMKSGDLAAAQIGIEMMEEDRGLAFGPIIKSNIPRALVKCDLTESHKERVRKRVVAMLLRPFLPKEFRQYAWLARRIGLGDWAQKLQNADKRVPWVHWYVEYLTNPNPPRPPWDPSLDRYFGGPWTPDYRP